MVDGTFAKQTWAALHLLPDYSRVLAGGAGCNVVCCTENGHRWNAQGGCDVHCARIVRQKQLALRCEFDKLRQSCFTGMICDGVCRQQCGYLGAKSALTLRSE